MTMELDANHSLSDSLKAIQTAGKGATLHLKSGAHFAGKIGSVGDHTVVLKELVGKEFYDAQICLHEIAAVEVRAR